MEEIDGIRVVKRTPTLSEFRALRINAGWKLPPDSMIDSALSKTIFGVCAELSDGQAIGMGRVVGDGGIQLIITDIIVHTEWQSQGLGTRIVKLLLEYIENQASPATFVGLFSAFGRHQFYEKLGFIVRPNETLGPGMMFFPKRTEQK